MPIYKLFALFGLLWLLVNASILIFAGTVPMNIALILLLLMSGGSLAFLIESLGRRQQQIQALERTVEAQPDPAPPMHLRNMAEYQEYFNRCFDRRSD
jgi:uncharacterized protein YhhL (DUF1145 family)